MSLKTVLYYHDVFIQHDTGFSHPEAPDRLRKIVHHLKNVDLWESYNQEITRKATMDELQRVHDIKYIKSVLKACETTPQQLDPDTWISEKSCDAALFAAGSGLQASDAIMAGTIDNAFCIVRPPGHHAERDRAKGFCLFNNIAVAAQYLISVHGLERILILDWDVHHGNGTQNAFYDKAEVFFLSLHEWPLFPHTGLAEETGEGPGLGSTRNILLQQGTQASDYLPVFEREVANAFQEFKPQFLLMSAGFDAHINDPLANLSLQEKDFYKMTTFVVKLAAEYTQNRIISFLEGGYSLNALAHSVEAHVRALNGQKFPEHEIP